MALMQTLQENMNDNSFNTALWNRGDVGTATIAEQNERWEIALVAGSAGTHYGVATSDVTYDLTGSYLFLEVVQVPTNLGGNGEATLTLEIDSNNRLSWQFEGTYLLAVSRVAGASTTVASVSYNATSHRWWRIRESGGTVYWDTSANGSTWNNVVSQTNPFAVTALSAAIYAGTFASIAVPGTAIFDNINVAPVTTVSVAVFPAVRPRIHVGIYEPLGSPQQGQPLAHMDIDVDVTALTWTERLPGGANTMEIGLESPRERSGWGDSLAFIPHAIRTKFFADVIVKAGPVPVWRGRWVENIIGPEGVQGGIIDGYGVSAVNDDYFESTDTVATTTGAVTQQLLTDAAPLLLKGNSSEWSDPGVAHAPADAHGMTPAEWLDQVSKEGGTANVSWDWYLTPDLRVVLLPRTAPDTPHYRVGYDPERMDMRENVRECFGTIVVVYTRDGVEQETAEDTNPLFASIYSIRRRLRIVGDEMTPEGALQLQQTQLARRLEPSLSVTMDLGTGEYLTAPSGVAVPHWLVRAGQWVDIADRGQFVIVNLNYNARSDEITLDLGEPSRADFDAYLADTCASVTKLAVGINPRYGGKRGRVRQLTDTGTAAAADIAGVNTYLNALRAELLDKHLMG